MRWSSVVLVSCAVLACPHDFSREGSDSGLVDARITDMAMDVATDLGDVGLPPDLTAPDTLPHPDLGCSLPCVETVVGGLSNPIDVAVSSSKLYVTETYSHRILLFVNGSPSVIGTSVSGHNDGSLKLAQFVLPMGAALDAAGQMLYVTDYNDHRIRTISSSAVGTLAGAGIPGAVDGALSTAQFFNPSDVAVDSAGKIYVADYNNHRIRVISGNTVETLAGSGQVGFDDNANALSATFHGPTAVAVDSTGQVYVADYDNHAIRIISGNATSGYSVSTLAGTGMGGFNDGSATQAQFNCPIDVAVDSAGKVYVADYHNHAIRVISGGVVKTLAGSGTAGFNNGPATQALFNHPTGLDLDSADVYVADRDNGAIRVIRQ